MIRNFFCLIGLLAIWGCEIDTDRDLQVRGYRPIYAESEAASAVSFTTAQPLKQPGKIYAFGQWVFVNELGKGIHIIDNSDPRNPQKVSFLSIPGNVDMAVKDGFLYADNYTDLVVINIANPRNPSLVKRLPNALPPDSQMYPPYTDIYFECVDVAKGVVVGWEEVDLDNPRCRR